MYAVKYAPKGYNTVMRYKGFTASLMQAPRLIDREEAYGLPPGTPIPVYPVDAISSCPESWIRGAGNYVCPVVPETGIWFNFTQNDHMNTAVLLSVKGINPITGQKLEGLTLEKYEECCPVHKVKFQGDLFCSECNYKWPPQNYVCYPNIMWFDGFRQPDGTVRQFFFSEDEKRDIASLVIGKQNTVPAFGFAFYQPKTARQAVQQVFRGGISGQSVNAIYTCGNLGPTGPTGPSGSVGTKWAYEPEEKTSGIVFGDSDMNCLDDGHKVTCAVTPSTPSHSSHKHKFADKIVARHFASPLRAVERKDVAVGAGAKIQQELTADPLKVTEWKEEAAAVVRLYFVFEEQFKELVEKGINDLEGKPEGYLENLPVG